LRSKIWKALASGWSAIFLPVFAYVWFYSQLTGIRMEEMVPGCLLPGIFSFIKESLAVDIDGDAVLVRVPGLAKITSAHTYQRSD
jgi:hypothetical protein